MKPDSGEVGEVITRANVVMAGYWRQPEATDAVIVDGWFHTGDMALLDSEGYIEVVDRKKDLIISGGENISSIEVEGFLYKHPAVLEAAVIAAPDERWGEVPVRACRVEARRPGDGSRVDRVLPRAPGALQMPEAHRVHRRAAAHRDRQDSKEPAARAVLERRSQASELNRMSLN